MNEFSLVCRLLGTLFYRHPQDPILAPVFDLITQGKLKQHWPLEQDELLERLQAAYEPAQLEADYIQLFVDDACGASPYRSAYDASDEAECKAFLQQVGMPLNDGKSDHFGLLLLTASWIEDHTQAEDELIAQVTLFDHYLFPWCGRFLGKVESHATTAFYRTLAIITREALQAMRDELSELEEKNEQCGDVS